MKTKNNPNPETADQAYKDPGYAEYTAAKKPEGKYLAARVLMVAGYVAVFAVIIALAFIVNALTNNATGMFSVVLFSLAPLATWIMVHFTWRYVSIEYRYLICHARFEAFVIYGGVREKKIFSCLVSEMTLIAPYEGKTKFLTIDLRLRG